MKLSRVIAVTVTAMTLAGCDYLLAPLNTDPKGNVKEPSHDMKARIGCAEDGGIIVYGYRGQWVCVYPKEKACIRGASN